MRRRPLSDEERTLWRRAVKDVRPARPVPLEAPPHAPDWTIAAPRAPNRSRGQALNPAAPPSAPARHFVFGGGDPALDRAAVTRRIAVDRVIDLHGLTQTEAHRLLVRRIPDAAAHGERLLIVITGKGRAARGMAGGGGVLRVRFLDWVEEHPLKGLIARVAQAKPKDGGAGAFYVFLKKKGAGSARADR